MQKEAWDFAKAQVGKSHKMQIERQNESHFIQPIRKVLSFLALSQNINHSNLK